MTRKCGEVRPDTTGPAALQWGRVSDDAEIHRAHAVCLRRAKLQWGRVIDDAEMLCVAVLGNGVNLLRPDFVLCVGDLVSGSADPEKLAAQWEEFDAINRELDAPFYYCPGNHDVGQKGSLQAYIERHGVGGRSYYSFDRRRCHFVILDTTTALASPASADEQLAWLAKDLAVAKDALHVFMIYHHPLWEDQVLWPRLAKLLDPAKTTIFNGHWHQLRQGPPETGIPTYALASTGTKIDPIRRATGDFHMFAHVTVDAGRPTIALIPLQEVLGTEYAGFTTAAATLVAAESAAISASGGTFEFRRRNPLTTPVQVALSWQAPGWQIDPPAAELKLAPGEAGAQTFTVKPPGGAPSRPHLTAAYNLVDPVGKASTVATDAALGLFLTRDIPRVKAMTVDGDLADWADIQPIAVQTKEAVCGGAALWSGPADGSYALRVAQDGQRLYVAVDVSDDELIDDRPQPLQNDVIEFFWDSRAAAPQVAAQEDSHRHSSRPVDAGGPGGEGTGQLILPLPPQGQQPKPSWNMGKLPVPQGLTCACRRRDGGYVYEFSLPLKELGVGDAAAASRLNLEIQLDDRDAKGSTIMSTSGMPNSSRNTAGYIRGALK